ncbi:MAG: ABC transporter substrate-binding protein [Actinomycetia bacterium]|nr:ABC transporter substrate-binding protein [Actinomycetes bacterium]
MNRVRRQNRKWVGLLAVVAMVLAACGGDDATTTTAAPATTEAPATTQAPATTEAPATTAAEEEPEPAGARIVIGLGTEPGSLDPQAVDQFFMFTINDNVFDKLVTRNSAGDLVPGVATDLGTPVDDTTWQFTVQEGVNFHNGEALNADAVVHSVLRIIDPDYPTPLKDNLGTVVGAEKVDEYTVNILTSGPDPLIPTRMTLLYLVPPEASQSADFSINPVGSGAYRFVSWDPGIAVELEANPDYRGGTPAITNATFTFIEEYGTRLAGVLNNEIDIMVDVLPEDNARVDQVWTTPAGLKQFIVSLNARAGSPVGDVRVRKALNHAVDKEAIAEGLFSGIAGILQGQMLSPNWFGFNPDLDPYPYDPDLARELLAEAGASDLEIQLVSLVGNSLLDRETTEAVAAFWAEVGVTAEIFIPEFSEYIDRLIDRENRPDAIFVPHDNILFDGDRTLSAYYHSQGCCGSMDPSEADDWIDAGRTEIDLDERLRLYQAVGQAGHDEAWYVWLISIPYVFGGTDRIEWTARADGLIHLVDIGVSS